MTMSSATVRVPFEDLVAQLTRVLVQLGFEDGPAHSCAQLFAEADRDGVRSHGLARFPRFVDDVRRGTVKPQARAQRVSAPGAAWEQWDGQGGGRAR